MPTLADELMPLAITEKGDAATSTWLRLDNGVAGAHLMDLALAGRVRLDDEVLVVADARPTGDGPLDATLSEIAGVEAMLLAVTLMVAVTATTSATTIVNS
jgi:hypothetical protein